jgi:hypothetical protein
MGTIVNSPRPNGPIGYVTIGGQRLPVEADPVWWRYWTEQQDATRILLPGTIDTSSINIGAATDVIENSVPSFLLTADAFTPDSQAARDAVISVTYNAPLACNVIVTLNALYASIGTIPGRVYIIGGIHINGQFSALNDTVSATSTLVLDPPSGDIIDQGSISTSRTFTVSANSNNTFVFLCKIIRPGAEIISLSNIFLRLEAIKV